MRRRNSFLVTLLAAVALAPASSAVPPCTYEEKTLDLSNSIVALGDDVGATIERAEGLSDQRLYRRFRRYGQRMRRFELRARRLRAIAPEELVGAHVAFRTSLTPVRRDLFDIARAAKQSNADAARRATVSLVHHSRALRRDRHTLVRKVRARLDQGDC